jgi:electron transfer flavoprotein-quinone oxidoreductase
VVVLRSKFDRWLADKVQEAIDAKVIMRWIPSSPRTFWLKKFCWKTAKPWASRTGGEKFYADSVILAEGVNNLLTRQVGLQDKYVPADHMLTGVKEIIRFDQNVLENRFS